MSSNLEKFNQLCRKVDNDNFSLDTWKTDDEYCYEYDDEDETDDSDDDFFDKGVSMVKVMKDIAIMSLGMDPVSKYVELVDEDCKLDDIAIIPVMPLPIQAYIFSCLMPKLPPLRKIEYGTIKGIEDLIPLKQRILQSSVPEERCVDGLVLPVNSRSDGTQLTWGAEVTMKLAGKFAQLPRRLFSRNRRTLMLLSLFLMNPGDGHDTGGQSERIEFIPTGRMGQVIPRMVVQTGVCVERSLNQLPERLQSHIGSDRNGIPVVDLPNGVRIGLNARRRDGEEDVNACIIS